MPIFATTVVWTSSVHSAIVCAVRMRSEIGRQFIPCRPVSSCVVSVFAGTLHVFFAFITYWHKTFSICLKQFRLDKCGDSLRNTVQTLQNRHCSVENKARKYPMVNYGLHSESSPHTINYAYNSSGYFI